MPQKNDESQILLAIQAMQNDPKLSARAAGKIYSVDHYKLSSRKQGVRLRRDITANSQKLSDLEETTIVQYVLDLDSRAFPPRLRDVEDMANNLCIARDASCVGLHWASNFVKRRPELKTHYNRKYDYQRALCEDPEVACGWFRLVENTISKYGIDVTDIYNFDETGFMMGIISTGIVVTAVERRERAKSAQPGNREWVTVIQGINSQGWAIPPFIIVAGKYHLSAWYKSNQLPLDWVIVVSENRWITNERGLEWIQHFDKYTKARTKGVYRLLILDGYKSHHSTDFELYCKDNKIITLCMPAHSSYILQPLDVGCFGLLKTAYGRQIENIMRMHITHITKVDFFPAFFTAFQAAITEENIKGGFRGTGLVPFNPESVILKLNIKLKTPSPASSRPSTALPWVSKTPNNPIEATSQSEFVKRRIAAYENSSPTSIYQAIDQFAKGTSGVMHKLILLQAEVTILRKANEVLSKRRRAKKTRLQQGGLLSLQNGQGLQDEKDIAQQVRQETQSRSGRKPRVEMHARRCGNCAQTGHNARTCQEDVDISMQEDSE